MPHSPVLTHTHTNLLRYHLCTHYLPEQFFKTNLQRTMKVKTTFFDIINCSGGVVSDLGTKVSKCETLTKIPLIFVSSDIWNLKRTAPVKVWFENNE